MKVKRLNKKSDTKTRIILALALIILAVASRVFMPYPPNFAPIAAIAIFSGAILPRRWALSLPLLAIIISDLFIGMHSTVMFTWGSFVLIAFLSNRFLKNIRPATVMGASLAASVLFFIISNFGVWADGRLYDWTFSGLIACYVNALPFFRGTLMGDLFFTAVIFVTYAVAHNAVLLRQWRVKIHY